MRVPRGAVAVAACVLAAVLVPEAAFAASGPTVGGDVSRYQCAALPVLGDFAVVAVNTGLPTETNPCLADQLAWARTAPGTGHAAVDVYLAAANPSPAAASWWPEDDRTRAGKAVRSPYGHCTGGATRACAWVYGDSIGRDDVHRGVSGAVGRWWIDVEDDNTWSASPARNRAVVEGMTAGLAAAGKPVGLYALSGRFQDIIGTVPASSTLDRLPSWVAGAKDEAAALARCSGAPLTAGRLTLVQWAEAGGTLDHDVACGSLAPAPKPTIAGRFRAGSTLTARVEVRGPGSVHLAYRWTRDGRTIAKATHRTYRLKAADVQHRIAVTVTGTATGFSRLVQTSAAHRIRA